VKTTLRVLGLAAIAVFIAIQAWACLTGLAYWLGIGWALVLAFLLLWLRLFRLLQITILLGGMGVWHLPIVLALFLAAPRLFLMLPGVVSTYLAARRHPRQRWSA
jgi:hypothetical protein